jgi:hypothetical protein
MSCGVVLLYLDRLPEIAAEFQTARRGEGAAPIAPQPIQP